MALNRAFWKGRRVFLSGHTGFKGAWLAEWLLALDAEVSGYALAPPTRPALFDQLGLAHRVRHALGDINDLPALRRAVDAARPQALFHLAAQPLVRRSYVEPLETYRTNVVGTAHVLECCRDRAGLEAVVVVTTDKCYENREWVWGYREHEPLGGYDPYSSSKACAELVTGAYRNAFFRDGARVASARAGNVIGGGDWAEDRLVPDAMRAFMAGEAVRIRYPDAIRPWQHVLDPLLGYLMLAEALGGADGVAFAEAWNFGPDEADARPVRAIMDGVARRWGGAAAWRHEAGDHPHEAGFLKLDCAKARARLGWQPRLPLEAALDLTVDWYRAVAGGADAHAVTQAQIGRYLERLEHP